MQEQELEEEPQEPPDEAGGWFPGDIGYRSDASCPSDYDSDVSDLDDYNHNPAAAAAAAAADHANGDGHYAAGYSQRSRVRSHVTDDSFELPAAELEGIGELVAMSQRQQSDAAPGTQAWPQIQAGPTQVCPKHLLRACTLTWQCVQRGGSASAATDNQCLNREAVRPCHYHCVPKS